MDALRGLLARAERPLVILGGTVWTREACRDLQAFAESSGLPIASSFRFQDLIDNNHDHYVGDVGIGINPKLAGRVREADVLLVIGARLGEQIRERAEWVAGLALIAVALVLLALRLAGA